MVTIYNANYGENGNVTENVINVTKNLTDLENQVLELIKQGINTTKDLVVKTGKNENEYFKNYGKSPTKALNFKS